MPLNQEEKKAAVCPQLARVDCVQPTTDIPKRLVPFRAEVHIYYNTFAQGTSPMEPKI